MIFDDGSNPGFHRYSIAGKMEEIITLILLAFAISAIDLILSIIVSKDV